MPCNIYDNFRLDISYFLIISSRDIEKLFKMKKNLVIIIMLSLLSQVYCSAQNEIDSLQVDSTNSQLHEYQKSLNEAKITHIQDSIRKSDLLNQFYLLKTNETKARENLLIEINKLEKKDSLRKSEMLAKVESLKKTAIGYPVSLFNDTLFYVYTKIGASTPKDRATNITKRVRKLYDEDTFKTDSLITVNSDNTVDIVFGDMIIMSVSELDAIWNSKSRNELANDYVNMINTAIVNEKENNSFTKILTRIALVILVLAGIYLLIWIINKGHVKSEEYVKNKKDKWFKDLSYKEYTFLAADQFLNVTVLIMKALKWFYILVLLYLVLPLVFSIFPFTQGWANILFKLVWSPFRAVFLAVWDYIPNLFTIVAIYIVMKYFIKLVNYIFTEIENEKLKISGFHPDWAIPTFGIIKFLLYAFMFVLIFPYLPGSSSNIFKGVSVFIGVIFSLGSSSAIANLIAGLVITYMRPFKIGDRIKIGEMTGDVIEKTMLVTRLRTVKNEEITIPNASVLSGNTINYSSNSLGEGLIIHTTITIGYDVPWKLMHEALLEAALRTDFISDKPKPFVLQTSLDDFYVSYQVNAYTNEAKKQALIYSELHKNIQDVCNEKGIEIMSPHYGALRDGNLITIPSDYLKSGYKSPSFNIETKIVDDKPKQKK